MSHLPTFKNIAKKIHQHIQSADSWERKLAHDANLKYFIVGVISMGLPQWLSGKDSACQCRRHGFDPGSGRFPGEGNGNPLQYSCLGNPMDRGARQATVHGVAKELDTTQRLNNNNNDIFTIILND